MNGMYRPSPAPVPTEIVTIFIVYCYQKTKVHVAIAILENILLTRRRIYTKSSSIYEITGDDNSDDCWEMIIVELITQT